MHLKKALGRALALALILQSPGAPAAMKIACEQLFKITPDIPPRTAGFGLRTENQPPQTPVELLKYAQIKADLWQVLRTQTPQRQQDIEHLLAAVEFFDYNHTAEALLTNFLSDKKQRLDFTRIYDDGFFTRGAPFKSFLAARDQFLRVGKPAVSATLLLDIHRRIMHGGVEGVRADQLGVYRNQHWVGHAKGATALSPQEAEVIRQNPYLTFSETARATGLLNPRVWENVRIWGAEKGMILAPQDPVRVTGMIHYPYVMTSKASIIEIIKDSHPAIYNEIQNYRKGRQPGDWAPEEMEQALTKALVEERMSRFEKAKAELGPVVIGKNESPYIDLVADLQRDLVAIHPLLNGNGRSTRLLMNYLLTKEGLPPVRLVDPFLDIQVSQNEWRAYVHKGVVNSAQLQADIAYRIRNNFVVEYSPELLYPGLPEMISIALKKQGSPITIQDATQIKVDSDQFGAFLRTLVELHPEIRKEISRDRVGAMNRIGDLFVEFYKTKTLRFQHDKEGEREIGLRLVEPDFINLFGVNHAFRKDKWDAKINRWYDRNMLVWRGLSNRSTIPTRDELLNIFIRPSKHLASNSVFVSMREGFSLEEAIKKDFATYNREVITGELVDMAVDHHRTGPRYSESYGFSTSKREVVGRAFAMGAMVVAQYGQQMNPQHQALIKSRVNVATYRSIKDVDLGRLKAFDPEFSYIYGRQAEVMAIGGTDPDAVMLIQRLDETGQVIETFLRNEEKPGEVLIIKGRYVPGEQPLPVERITERVQVL